MPLPFAEPLVPERPAFAFAPPLDAPSALPLKTLVPRARLPPRPDEPPPLPEAEPDLPLFEVPLGALLALPLLEAWFAALLAVPFATPSALPLAEPALRATWAPRE